MVFIAQAAHAAAVIAASASDYLINLLADGSLILLGLTLHDEVGDQRFDCRRPHLGRPLMPLLHKRSRNCDVVDLDRRLLCSNGGNLDRTISMQALLNHVVLWHARRRSHERPCIRWYRN